jgi:hypothetical protein
MLVGTLDHINVILIRHVLFGKVAGLATWQAVLVYIANGMVIILTVNPSISE